MGLQKDRAEADIIQNKKKEYEGKISRLEKERDALGKAERNTMKEYEVFIDSMNKSAEYYQRAGYVQKAKLCSIFFSNILVDHKKRLHIAVKPIFEQLIISSGADDREYFEQVQSILTTIDHKSVVSLFGFYKRAFNKESGLLDSLNEKQKKYYQIA